MIHRRYMVETSIYLPKAISEKGRDALLRIRAEQQLGPTNLEMTFGNRSKSLHAEAGLPL
jgi:hypothetical protein